MLNLKKIFEKNKFILDIIIKDLSSLGSLVFYVFWMLFFLLIAEFILFSKLFLGLILSFLIIIIIRFFYYRSRPEKIEYDNFFQKIYSSSFPSFHAFRSFLLYGFLILYFKEIFLSIFLTLIYIGILFSRWYLKKHFISDLFFGFVFGIITFIFIQVLFFYF